MTRDLRAPSHDGFEESIYGLEGITTWTIDDHTVEIGPGEAVCVSRGQVHRFDNYGAIDAMFLAIATPAESGAAYFREIGKIKQSRPSFAQRNRAR